MAHPLEPIDATGRHPETQQLARWLTPNPHLAEGLPADVAAVIASLAGEMVNALPDGPMLRAGLWRLLEAKDSFVRAALDGVAPPGRGDPRRSALLDAVRPVPPRRGAAAAPVRRTPAPPDVARPAEEDFRVRGVERRQ